MIKKSRLIIGISFILLTGCPEQKDPPPERPPGVRIIPYSGGLQLTEQGIRAKAGPTNTIVIEWEALPSNIVLDRYDVYRSVEPDQNFRRVLSAGGSGLPIAEDDSVKVDTTYYYYVLAVNSLQVESDVQQYFESPDSIAVYVQSFTLGSKVTSLLHPTSIDTVVTTKPTFLWCPGGFPLNYVVRIGIGSITSPITVWTASAPLSIFELDCNNEQLREFLTYHDSSYAAQFQQGDSLFAGANVVTILRDQNVLKSPRLSKTTYFWRVDAIYGARHASASRWEPFLVNRDY